MAALHLLLKILYKIDNMKTNLPANNYCGIQLYFNLQNLKLIITLSHS